jgi:hypothetical protein
LPNGNKLSNLRIKKRNRTATGVSVKVDEDRYDTERKHVSEWVAYLAIEIPIDDAKYVSLGLQFQAGHRHVVHRSDHDDAGQFFSLPPTSIRPFASGAAVTMMQSMFYSTSNLDQAIGMWSTTAVTTMQENVRSNSKLRPGYWHVEQQSR